MTDTAVRLSEAQRRSRLKWKLFWMVQGPDGVAWLGSASPFSKRGSIQNWLNSSGGLTWKHWYGQGYRCRQFEVSLRVPRRAALTQGRESKK